jgi:anti-anti-sigma factor
MTIPRRQSDHAGAAQHPFGGAVTGRGCDHGHVATGSAAERFTTRVDRHGFGAELLRVTVAGEIDVVNRAAFEDVLTRAVTAPAVIDVEIDLSRVGYCDVNGIKALARAWIAAAERGVTLRIVHAQPAVRRVLEVGGVPELLTRATHSARPGVRLAARPGVSLPAGLADAVPGPYAGGDTVRCGELAVLPGAQAAMLAGLSGLVGDVRQCVLCELVADHVAHHVAFVAATDEGDRHWWMRWSPGGCQILALDMCARESRHGRHGDPCLLPVEHPGPHSFDLGA